MGVSTQPAVAAGAAGARRGTIRTRLDARLRSPRLFRRLALASIVVNVGIVVTGGAVRLTDSGLGCPTWPHCSGSQLVPSHKLGINGVIEFSNRLLTFVVALTLLATLVVAWRQGRQRGLAALAFLGIPAQAVLGGIVVLTHLNPWLVAAHFLLSVAVIGVTVVLWWRVSGRAAAAVSAAGVWLARGLLALTALVLAVGTVVTGTGPHAGALDEDNRLHRIPLSPESVSQLHADLVMALVGATVGMVALAWALRLPGAVRHAVAALLLVEVAQAAIGYTQYFLHVPAALVGVHMLGACLVWVAALRVWLSVRRDAEPRGAAAVSA
jgi:cytochrome c oxidase assembly protein subunit 15